MEKKQKLDWCFTCKFSEFAQAYIGQQKREDIIDFLVAQDQLSFANSQKFVNGNDVREFWDKYVEIRPYAIMENNGITILNLTVHGGVELECDCVDAAELINNIIK